jgi:Holliday junction resolvase RusA-like endonuclease
MGLSVTVPWKPHAKQRPRVANNVAYTPKATKDAEKAIREAFLDAVGDAPLPLDGTVRVDLSLANDHFNIQLHDAADYTQRKLRGDLDNYAKTILDSLNGVAYSDDSQIVTLTVEKQ